MDGTINGQGSFVVGAVVQPVVVRIPCGADWMDVWNYTQFGNIGTPGVNVGIYFHWQLGIPNNIGLVEYGSTGVLTMSADILSNGGFQLYDPSGQNQFAAPYFGTPIATTASTNATRPVVSTANTTNLIAGISIVRMIDTAQTDVNGIDMVVGAVTPGVNFTLLTATNALATAPGVIGGAGFYQAVNYDPLFYPRNRYITNITQAVNAQVSTSVQHNYVPGQKIRFNIPTVSGMVQLNATPQNNYLSATIVTVVDAFNFTININTTTFTAFTWPTVAQQPSSFPEVTPVGEDTAFALTSPTIQLPLDRYGNPVYSANSGILSDATVNTGYLGMILGTGGTGLKAAANISGPAGFATGDVVYWRAGKSTFGGQ